MVRERVLMLVVMMVARGAGRAEHGRRRDGPDLRHRDRRLRQVGQHQLRVVPLHAHATNPTPTPITAHYDKKKMFN